MKEPKIFKVRFIREINHWDTYWERITLVSGRMPSRHFRWTNFTLFARIVGDRVEIVTPVGIVAMPVYEAKRFVRSIRDDAGRVVDGEAGRCLFAVHQMATN